jgi:hypothetical protein
MVRVGSKKTALMTEGCRSAALVVLSIVGTGIAKTDFA